MLTISDFSRFKSESLVMATAYDFPFARLCEESGIDVILVGDSLANVVLGLSKTRQIGMHEMKVFVAAVARGVKNTHLVADMPFGSDTYADLALHNARNLIELGAHAVKIEGAKLESIRALVGNGIPVMGHLGLLPQSASNFKRVGGNSESDDHEIIAAKALVEAGVYAMVLEHMDAGLAERITKMVPVPTIGIGAGPKVNGQVLVLHDLLGLSPHDPPPFAKRFVNLRAEAHKGLQAYADAVRQGTFPG